MAKIGSLTADLRLESASFMRDMKAATNSIKSNTAQMNMAMRGLQRSASMVQRQFSQLRSGVMAFAGALAVRQFSRWTQQALQSADTLAKQAEGFQLSTKALQEYRGASMLAGISTERFDKGIERFLRNVGDARRGTGALVSAFKDQDKAFLRALTSTRSTEEALDMYLKRLNEAPDGFQRAAEASAGFGREGMRFAKILREGGGVLDDMRKRAVAMGLVLENHLAKAAEQVNDRMSIMKTVFEIGFQRSIITEFADAFQTTAENLEAARKAGENFGMVVGKSMRMLAEGVVLVGRHLREIVAVLASLAALKVAGLFVGMAAAVIQFSRAMIVAARSGVLLNTILSKSLLGAVASVVIALGVGAATYAAFEGEIKKVSAAADEQASALEKAAGWVDKADTKIQESIEQLKRDEENWRRLSVAVRGSEEQFRNMQVAIDLTNEAARLGAKEGTALGDAWMRAAVAAKRAELDFEKIKERADDLRKMGEQVGESISSAFESAITEGKKFKDVLKGLAQDMARLAFRNLVTAPLTQGFGNIFAAFAHTGAEIGKTALPRKQVSASVFAGAPRLHDGLKADEFPAILQKGETVIPKGGASNGAGGDTIYYSPNYHFSPGMTPADMAFIRAQMREADKATEQRTIQRIRERHQTDSGFLQG